MTARPFLKPEIVDRLAKVAGMLSSTFEGERANAAQLATNILRQEGLTWRDLVEQAARAADPPRRPRAKPRAADGVPPDLPPAALARWALGASVPWSIWERDFLCALAARDRAPSPKQQAVLDRLATKAALYEAGA